MLPVYLKFCHLGSNPFTKTTLTNMWNCSFRGSCPLSPVSLHHWHLCTVLLQIQGNNIHPDLQQTLVKELRSDAVGSVHTYGTWALPRSVVQHPLAQKARVTVLNPMGQLPQQFGGKASSRLPLTLQTESIWQGHCVSVAKGWSHDQNQWQIAASWRGWNFLGFFFF